MVLKQNEAFANASLSFALNSETGTSETGENMNK